MYINLPRSILHLFLSSRGAAEITSCQTTPTETVQRTKRHNPRPLSEFVVKRHPPLSLTHYPLSKIPAGSPLKTVHDVALGCTANTVFVAQNVVNHCARWRQYSDGGLKVDTDTVLSYYIYIVRLPIVAIGSPTTDYTFKPQYYDYDIIMYRFHGVENRGLFISDKSSTSYCNYLANVVICSDDITYR